MVTWYDVLLRLGVAICAGALTGAESTDRGALAD
jgi:hypothetical protein